MWCCRRSLHNSTVIPGKVAIAAATRNPGISKTLDTGFRRYDGKERDELFNEQLGLATSLPLCFRFWKTIGLKDFRLPLIHLLMVFPAHC
jgi:hypothetical protein